MRNKIDYGIDLGTTNSAIARMEDGTPVIKKSDTLKDTMPSCINFNKRQDILVGDPAFNVMKNENIRALKTFDKGKVNTFIEFKRKMGTTYVHESSNMGRGYSPEELSAEVLKKLKSFVDENISSIVITVPAKFLNPQNEATMQAAKLAGFKHVELLQEPVAAATAYGMGSKNKNGFWLVFDFGGGTFDAAIVKAEGGILSVKDTDGDNWLGGKNLDEAIVDEIIIPNLVEKFELDSVMNDVEKRQIMRDAVKFKAEEAKIQLSFKDSHHILSDLDDLPFEDDNGDQPEIDVLVTEKDLERVLSPIFQKAIDITLGLLKRNNLKGSDLGALILVGGPTYSPIVRKMLKEQVTEKVDTSVDPMTVVAKGAALFASTISVSDEVKDITRDKTKLQLDLKYEATTVELEEMVSVKLLKEKTSGAIPDKLYVELVRSDGAWASAKKLVGEKAVLVDVALEPGQSNTFSIRGYDGEGNKLACEPNQFSILQGIGGLDGMQVLPYFIGIGRYFQSEEKDLFQSAKGLEKNKKVPAVGVINGLKTRKTIRPGIVADVIRIPIYEGDYNADGTNPLLNNWVGEVVITGESLPALLPEGSDVDLTIKIDQSRLVKVYASFPLLNHTEEVEIDINKTKEPTEKELAVELSKAKRTAQRVKASDVIGNLEALEAQLENEKGSADGKMKILDGLRKELLKLDGAEKTAEWPAIEQELKDIYYDLEDLVEKIKAHGDTRKVNMEKVEVHLKEYKTAVEHVIKEKNIKEAKHLTMEIDAFDYSVRNAVTDNAPDVQLLEQIDEGFNGYHWKDKNKARQLVNQGLQLATAGNTSAILPILRQLFQLMPEGEKPKETLGDL